MINYIKEANQNLVLHAITINSIGEREPQPYGFPEMTILKLNNSTVSSVLKTSALLTDVPGEYYYNWLTPSNIGYYKVRYKVSIESEITYGYDFIEIVEPVNEIITVVGL
jgi:hypothetical protein